VPYLRRNGSQNLSHKLIQAVAGVCPQSAHVRMLGLGSASDTEIWEYARENGFCVVTQDTGFVERALAGGTPPPVICLRLGNKSTQQVRDTLMRTLPTIISAIPDTPPPHVGKCVSCDRQLIAS
jgi:predicted nuclease of predicted toxin-antitoxin system